MELKRMMGATRKQVLLAAAAAALAFTFPGFFSPAAAAPSVGGAPVVFASDDRDDKADKKDRERTRKREEREYKKMPKDVRKTIKKEVDGADDVDYFTAEENGREVYGARFVADDGREYEVRVDDDGDLISRNEVIAGAANGTTDTAAAPAPADAAAQPAAAADRPAEKVSAEQMPDAARKTIHEETVGSKDAVFYRVWESGFVIYHATYTTAKGENLRLYVSEDGTVLRKRNEYDSPVETVAGKPAIEDDKLELSELPGPAQEQFRKLTEGGTDVRFFRAMLGSKPCYQALFTDRDGRKMSVRVADNGEVLQSRVLEEAAGDPKDASVTADQLPQAARAAVEREAKGASGLKIYRAKLGSKSVYNARFRTADGRDMSIRVDDAGNVVDSKQLNAPAPTPAKDPKDARLTLDEMPAAVRETIERETKGASKVEYYRAKLGKRDVTEAEFTNADGKRISIRVDETGKVVDRREDAK